MQADLVYHQASQRAMALFDRGLRAGDLSREFFKPRGHRARPFVGKWPTRAAVRVGTRLIYGSPGKAFYEQVQAARAGCKGIMPTTWYLEWDGIGPLLIGRYAPYYQHKSFCVVTRAWNVVYYPGTKPPQNLSNFMTQCAANAPVCWMRYPTARWYSNKTAHLMEYNLTPNGLAELRKFGVLLA